MVLQARKDAAQFAATQLETLSDKTKTPTSQLKFIMDAWAQVRGQTGHICKCATPRASRRAMYEAFKAFTGFGPALALALRKAPQCTCAMPRASRRRLT